MASSPGRGLAAADDVPPFVSARPAPVLGVDELPTKRRFGCRQSDAAKLSKYETLCRLRAFHAAKAAHSARRAERSAEKQAFLEAVRRRSSSRVPPLEVGGRHSLVIPGTVSDRAGEVAAAPLAAFVAFLAVLLGPIARAARAARGAPRVAPLVCSVTSVVAKAAVASYAVLWGAAVVAQLWNLQCAAISVASGSFEVASARSLVAFIMYVLVGSLLLALPAWCKERVVRSGVRRDRRGRRTEISRLAFRYVVTAVALARKHEEHPVTSELWAGCMRFGRRPLAAGLWRAMRRCLIVCALLNR
jgi:hypothetical protein